ncbi:class I SAM-dependent methyltransferase [Patulibacter sp. S7RM1-6]
MNPGSVFDRLLDGGADRFLVRAADGGVWSMPIGRWLAPAGAVDERALDRAVGPVLDVGCGPGRHVHALDRRGVVAVGVELSPTAVRHARSGGARVIEGSIFDVAPDAGCWATALLLDGNIGIGGDPEALLRRVAGLLCPDGRIVVELEPDADAVPGDAPVRVRMEDGEGTASDWFPWAWVAPDAIDAPADAAGLDVVERWADGGRHFCVLRTR